MEQRRYFRTQIGSAEVHISDHAGFCTGSLKDCSRFGLCISDIPRKIHTQQGYFTAVISKDSRNFKLKIKECWRAQDGLSLEIGGVIEDVAWDWTEMVMKHEPKNDDVWGSAS